MKTIISSIILFLFAFSNASAQLTKAELQVAGLTCSMCSRSVDKQLQTLDFIDSIGIDLEHATFNLYFKKDKPVDFYQIKNKVEDAGFSVVLLKPTYKFDNLKIEANAYFKYQNMTFYFLNVSPQTLNGNVTMKIVDSGFINNKEYKKYASQISGLAAMNGIYHVIL